MQDLERVDRRDPEQLHDAGEPLAHERERRQRHGHVLEDQRDHGGPEERRRPAGCVGAMLVV